jgi:phage anti-repressor protein
MEDLFPFLKKHSDVDTDVIAQFIQIQKGDGIHAPFSIDLDTVAQWLKTKKEKLLKILKRTYTRNIDYILLNGKTNRKSGSGEHNKELILLTPDTFGMITMQLKTKKSKKVRDYYIALEKIAEFYVDNMLGNLNKRTNARVSDPQNVLWEGKNMGIEKEEDQQTGGDGTKIKYIANKNNYTHLQNVINRSNQMHKRNNTYHSKSDGMMDRTNHVTSNGADKEIDNLF